jgi:hypothetical protein
LATYRVASHVDALQTSTGTKDKIAQHWIDILIEKSREMQASTPGRSVDEISNELLVWLAKETDQPYNPLLDLPCAFLFVSSLCSLLISCQSLTRPKTLS